jgi:hypothetical protein
MFQDSERVIHVDFLPHCVTLMHSIILQCCASSDSEDETWETVKGDHPTAGQCLSTYSRFDKGDIGNSGLGNHESPSLHADLAPSDFHLFGPVKVPLGGQKFQSDDELKHSVLN